MCELPDAYTCSEPVARKEHKCCECRRIIAKSEKYHRFSGIYSFGCESFATCQECQRLREWYIETQRLRHEEIPAFGYLYDDMRDSDVDIDEAKRKAAEEHAAESAERIKTEQAGFGKDEIV